MLSLKSTQFVSNICLEVDGKGRNSKITRHRVRTRFPTPARTVCDASSREDIEVSHQLSDVTRRNALWSLNLAVCTAYTAYFGSVGSSLALGFKKELKKKGIPAAYYEELGNGLRVYDISKGNGKTVEAGDLVKVHFDCYFRGLDVVSTRSARVLVGNRILAEPLEIIAGGDLPKVSARSSSFDSESQGLFMPAGGPKPPPALTQAVLGMQVGGKRSVLVPPEQGYGAKGEQEIPPNTGFELQIELLERKPK
uniref:peptidylprolyl isomerase n=2 Tax=Tetraselmis sp. GSL018 TaxID=582737 RepID=A0A061S102_9CHLO